MNDFYKELADILEINVDKINPDFDLNCAKAPWDSLAIVSTIALANDHFNILLSGQDLINCKIVKDIETLITNSKGA
jgi:acyl carrier protein